MLGRRQDAARDDLLQVVRLDVDDLVQIVFGVDAVLAVQRDGVVVVALVRVAARLLDRRRIDARTEQQQQQQQPMKE